MKFLDEYRAPEAVSLCARRINALQTRPWTLIEVCGGQTHAILRNGLASLLPESLRLIHGPGCPVCVTPIAAVDQAIAIAARPEVIFCSFGDMLRVPGSRESLLDAKARGADLRVLYSPLDAIAIAEANPSREVVFFAIGFETTAPGCAMALWQARKQGLANFSLLLSQFRIPPAIAALLAEPDCRIDALLAPGHVCAVSGLADYRLLAERHRLPIVVAGFEALDLMQAMLSCVTELEAGRHGVLNGYRRVVRDQGNPAALALMNEVFRVTDREWRGLGVIPDSGLSLAPAWSDFDAGQRFAATLPPSDEHGCPSGEILRGTRTPDGCPHFGLRCTPEHPLGAPMVSSEGACAAYHRCRIIAGAS